MKRGESARFKSKSQSWSIDILLAVIIFITVVLIVMSIISKDGVSQEKLEKEASYLAWCCQDEGKPFSFVVDGRVIDPNKLLAAREREYDILKQEVGAAYDFCIRIEDENGNIIYVNNTPLMIGSPDILFSNVSCGRG